MNHYFTLLAHMLALSCYLYGGIIEARRQRREEMTRDLLVSLSYGMLCLEVL